MAERNVDVILRHDPGSRTSRIVIHRGVAYLASQVADDPAEDFASEARAVLAQVDALLEEAGSRRDRLLTATIFLSDMALFDAMNEVWAGWIPPGEAPTRVTVETRLTRPCWRIAVQVTAAVRTRRLPGEKERTA